MAMASLRVLALAAAASAVLLTPTNWVDRTKDKQALILFTGKTKGGRLLGEKLLKVFARLEEWVQVRATPTFL